MLVTMFGVFLIFFAANQMAVTEDRPQGEIFYQHPTKTGLVEERGVAVKPLSEFRFKNVVRQAYDYSCGSAAMTTILNHYLGRQFEERQVMEGLLRFGETERIVERRGFSLLDMRRLATALGHPSGGFRAEMKDIRTLEHPAIVPIDYGGFKHFVVLRQWENGRIHVADPALGNTSFSETQFEKIWDQNVLFIVFPDGVEPREDLALRDHDLRFVDDRTVNLLAFKEFPVFTKTMEQWADKASTLQRVLIRDDEGIQRIINVPTRTYIRR